MSTWFRISTDEGVVFGEVRVPPRAPTWFAPILKEIQGASARTIDMGDISADEWVGFCCSKNQPIPLLKPLSPQRSEEPVFFRSKADFFALKEKTQEMLKTLPKTEIVKRLQDDDFIRENGGMFLEDMRTVSPQEAEKFERVPRSEVQPGIKPRTMVNYVPLVNEAEDEIESFVLFPQRINHVVQMQKSHEFSKIVNRVYGSSVEQTSPEALKQAGLQIEAAP